MTMKRIDCFSGIMGALGVQKTKDLLHITINYLLYEK
jgi:hypothetical protein